MRTWMMVWCGFLMALGIGLMVTPASASGNRLFSGDVALGYGWTGAPTQTDDLNNHEQSLVGFFRLKVCPPGVGGANLEFNLRHPFADNDPFHYFRGKRELRFQLNVPIQTSPGTSLFVLYQRAYSGRTNDFMVAGIRQSF